MQTSITDAPEIGLEGQIATSETRDLITATITAPDLQAGLWTCRDAGNGTAKKIGNAGSAAASEILGVIHRDQAREPSLDLPLGSEIAIVRRGVVYVRTESACTAGQPVFVRHTLAPGTVNGASRHDADGANAVAVSGARFRNSAGAGEIVAIEINLP